MSLGEPLIGLSTHLNELGDLRRSQNEQRLQAQSRRGGGG